jgi:hypothetical protein
MFLFVGGSCGKHRNVRQQIGMLVSEAYKEKYGDQYGSLGIGSVGQKNTV